MNGISRVRINSPRYHASITAEVASVSLQRLNPETISDLASCDLFSVGVAPQYDDILTFNVSIPLCNTPKDPEAVLNLIRSRVENLYDMVAGGQLVR